MTHVDRSRFGPVTSARLTAMTARAVAERAEEETALAESIERFIRQRRKDGHPLPWRSDEDGTDLTSVSACARSWRALRKELRSSGVATVCALPPERVERWTRELGDGAATGSPPRTFEPVPIVVVEHPRRPVFERPSSPPAEGDAEC